MSDRVKLERQAMSPLKNDVDEQDEDRLGDEGDDYDGDGMMDDDEGGLMMLSNSNSLDGTCDNGDYDDRMTGGLDEDGESHNGVLRLLRPGHGRANKVWTQPIEQAFLEKIKAFPCLYDHRDENWKNKKHKDGIWGQIAEEIGIPGSECRRHFKHMRDKFVRNKRTGKSQNTKFTRGMSFLVDLDLIKHRPRPMDDIHFLGTVSKSSSRNGSGRSSPVMDLHRNYSSSLPGTKRHYLDISNGDDDQDYDDSSSYGLADTVMEPESSPLSSVTITRTNPGGSGTASIPSRRSLISNAARTLSNLMAAKNSLGNGSFSIGSGNGIYSGLNGAYSTTNGMSMSSTVNNVSSNNGTHVIVPNGGYTVPRTINQTTITPAVTVTPTIVPKPISNGSSSSAHANGHSNGNSGSGSGSSGNSSGNGNNSSSNNSSGPNYFFGQYIASVLDSLPQAESLLTRHKLQEILFEAQSRVSPPQKQLIDFKCANCCKIYQGSAQLP